MIKPQEYINCNDLDNKENYLLYNLRCRSENSFKDNIHKMYQNLDCPLCGKKHLEPEDNKILSAVRYDDIFGTIDRQVPTTKLFRTIIRQKQAPYMAS